jgi:6-phosphogluconolactonase
MQYFAVGSYTSPQGHAPGAKGPGISLIAFDDSQAESDLIHINSYSELENPGYLAWDPSRRLLYAAGESGGSRGAVEVFSLNRRPGEAVHPFLQLIARTAAKGTDACHISVSAVDMLILTASYGGGSIAGFRLDDSGLPIAEHSRRINYLGSGPNTSRQEAPHAHQILKIPGGEQILVCDLGSDTIWSHRISQGPELLTPPNIALRLPGGSGPRHLAFDPLRPAAYILCELEPLVLACSIDMANGSLSIGGEYRLSDSGGQIRAPAAIKIHPSGKTLAVSDRFVDRIELFRIERGESDDSIPLLTTEGVFPCMGKTPRDIEFNPDGSLLLIANQDSDEITSLRFDPQTGLCNGQTGPAIASGAPTCIVSLGSEG